MADTARYLIDKSAWEQRRYDARARRRVSELRESGALAVCIVTVTEILYSARNAEEIGTIRGQLDLLAKLPVTEAADAFIYETMSALAVRGHHRLSPPAILIAAIALAHDAVVLHYDSDFERIAGATGLRHEWIVPTGTGHRRVVGPGH